MATYNTINIEPGWQMITVPVVYGYWDISTHEHVYDENVIARIKNYIFDQIEDLYGSASDKIAIYKTYIGDTQKYYNYIGGVTPDDNENNFPLAWIDDSDNVEYTSFWVYNTTDDTITITHLDPELEIIDGGTYT
jgi:hypothetical protein